MVFHVVLNWLIWHLSMWINILKKCCLASKPILPLFGGALLSGCGLHESPAELPSTMAKPNIVLIYSDDVGYGDLSCYGQKKISTPNIDALAKKGLLFTNAYAAAATCSPSRYALLTGEYAFRKKGTNILSGQANMIISPKRRTLPSLLQSAGYETAVVGKWHLGLDDKPINWNSEIHSAPLDVGFNYSFILPATGDRVPCVYIENRQVVNLDANDPITVSYDEPFPNEPTGKTNPQMLKMMPLPGHDGSIINGVSRMGFMKGGKRALWNDEEIAITLVEKARKFIEKKRESPFFLYFSTHDIHTPRIPHPRFKGKSGLGPRGDALLQLDWCVGEIVACLEKQKLTEKTIILFTSDNGPVLRDGYEDMARELYHGENPTGGLRGGKYSIYDGGMRVPMIICFPKIIKPGRSNAMISQVDFLASFAKLTGQKVDPEASPDSLNMLDAMLGFSEKGRDSVVVQGASIALLDGIWKYITPTSGWVSYDENTGIETGIDSRPQLYDMVEDVKEKINLADAHPEITEKMAKKLKEITLKTSKY
jgi:arylsulfatase A-like enzyme